MKQRSLHREITKEDRLCLASSVAKNQQKTEKISRSTQTPSEIRSQPTSGRARDWHKSCHLEDLIFYS